MRDAQIDMHADRQVGDGAYRTQLRHLIDNGDGQVIVEFVEDVTKFLF